MDVAPAVIALAAVTSQLVFLIVALVVGVRLLLLARRTRELPVLLLAINFSGSGLGYGLGISAALLASVGEGTSAAETVSYLAAAGALFTPISVSAVAVFVYRVFRAGELWARVVAWLAVFWMWMAFVGRILSGIEPTPQGLWWWLTFAGFNAVGLWVIVEAFLYHAIMRRRLRLGLADPVLTNRFLLWGGGGLFALAGGILGAILTLRSTDSGPGNGGLIILSLIATLGISCALCYWLTFFPTTSYIRFLKRRHPGAQAA